jgi:transcriptional regulator with XRE-family HTH domain
MKADDPRSVRWREATNQALREAGLSQGDIANELGCSRARVSHWLAEGNRYGPPEPEVVFVIEDLLGCRNMLATILGYQRADDVTPSVETAVQADPGLTPDQKELLAVQLASMRQATQARRSRRSPRRS